MRRQTRASFPFPASRTLSNSKPAILSVRNTTFLIMAESSTTRIVPLMLSAPFLFDGSIHTATYKP